MENGKGYKSGSDSFDLAKHRIGSRQIGGSGRQPTLEADEFRFS
jgi:hypothetical protein